MNKKNIMFIGEKIANNRCYIFLGFTINIMTLFFKERILYSRKTLRNELI